MLKNDFPTITYVNFLRTFPLKIEIKFKMKIVKKIDVREPTLWTGKFSTTRQQQQPSKQILLAQYVVQLSSHLVGSFQHSDVHRIISIKTVNFKTDINVGGWQNCQCPWHASYGTRPAAEADRQFAKRAVGTLGAGEQFETEILYRLRYRPKVSVPVLELKLFFPKLKLFLFQFYHLFSNYWGNISFYKL